ncbi:MAG: translocation/assembly module TamB domain-containing protein [Prevotella sp.]
MKRFLRWTLGILLTPVLLFLILIVLLYLPPVQNFVVHRVADYMSETTGATVSVDRVSLRFPLDLSINDVLFIQPNDSLPQVRDTIADVRNIVADVKLWSLLKGKVIVEDFEINNAKLNTAQLIPSARIRGSVGQLKAECLADLAPDAHTETHDMIVRLASVSLSKSRLDVALSDTVPPDTTSASVNCLIAVKSVDISDTGVTLHMPNDTLQLYAYLGDASIADGEFDLARESYAVGSLRLSDAKLNYDDIFQPRLKGLDYNHVALSDIRLSVDSILYCAPDARMKIVECSMKEKSGIVLSSLQGGVTLDSTKVSLPRMTLTTPDSNVELECDMDLNAFDDKNPGKVYLRLFAELGKQDIMRFAGDMPQQFIRRYPNRPLSVRLSLNGNMRHARISGLDVSLPTAFKLNVEGYAANPMDINRMKAEMRLRGTTYDIGFLTALAPMPANIRIPSGITMAAHLKADRQLYSAEMRIAEGRGTVTAKGKYNNRSAAYSATAKINNVNVRHFMPRDSIGTVNCNLTVDGRGFNPLHRSTRMTAEAKVNGIRYGHFNLKNTTLTARIADGVGHVVLVSENELLDGTISIDALMSTKRVLATLAADVRWADLYAMRLMEQPFVTSMCAHVDVASDIKQTHSLQALVNDLTLRTAKKTYRPKDLSIDFSTSPDTTWAKASSGNLQLDFRARGGYEKLLAQMDKLMAKVEQQRKEKVIDEEQLRALLPTLRLNIKSGNDNPVANILRYKGFDFQDLSVTFRSSPERGMGGRGHIYKMNVDSIPIDTMRFLIRQDSTRVNFRMMVQNNKRNPQLVFKSIVNGYLDGNRIGADAQFFDKHDVKGLDIGVMAEMLDSGINVHLTPYEPLIGYKTFRLNDDNFVFLGRDNRVSAKVDLIADDGTGVKVYSDDTDPTMLQDLTVSVNRLNLEQVTSVLPFMPLISGMMNGDFHLMQDAEKQISVVSDMQVGNMAYERMPMGNLGSEFVYLQDGEDRHRVEARISRNDSEIGVLSGVYDNSGDGYLDATLDLVRTPLSMVNGFIPDQLIGFDGYAEGHLTVAGALSSPQVNGELYVDSAYVKSVPYGVVMRCDNDPVRIVGSNLRLENFTLYGDNNSPLTVYGNVDFSNLDLISMNMQMKAKNYQIISAKKSSKSLAYGKAFVNFGAIVKGPLEELNMRGTLDVLGSTNITYILRDSPLNTNDRLSELVTFTDFSDTTRVVQQARPAVGGLDMLLMMNVEQGARVRCFLNPDQSNYVDVEGGGELRMTYNDYDGMQLFGRYTINDGEMKYQLPVIPLKTFTIGQGSYVEFTGDVMNPRLNLTATERVKALVTSDGGSSRSVAFDCGVKVTKTLNDMGLEFTLDAPDDMSVKNELTAMSVEERGKLAVTMLTTGMYLNGESGSNVTMNSALNAFLQGEINNITQSAMSTFDLSLGIEQNANAAGQTYTDYSFKFSKHFWNNRFNFVIGGSVSTGNAAQQESDGTFIDNVSLEYRLDQSAMRYVRLFYDKNKRDILDERIAEYGAGLVWRRKLESLSDLFRFGKTKTKAPQDTTKTLIKDENKK